MSYSIENWPFDSKTPKGNFERFRADGFENPVVGIVFKGGTTLSGVPLGGLGTGYIEISGDGRLGRCSIFNDICPPRELNIPLLALTANREIYVLTDKAPQGTKGVEDIRYFGHFPVADIQFDLKGPIQIALRAFTPFVLGDSKVSNTPAALFSIRLANISENEVNGKLAFSFPGPKGETPFKHSEFSGKVSGVSVIGKRGMGYALAALGKKEVYWGAELGTKKNPWTALLEEELPLVNESESGATLAIDYALGPGETKEIRLLLGWFYPYFKDSSGEPHTHHYFRQFKSAQQVIEFAGKHFDELHQQTLAWQAVIYDSDEPDWLKDALINSLYSLAKNTLWVVSDRADNWYPEVGFFTHSESFTGCPITETMVCRMQGHFPILFFFPELEHSTLTAFKHFQIRDGEIPFSFGTPTSLRDPRYHCQHPLNSGQYVQMIYRYFMRAKDKEFLDEFYDSAKDAVNYQKTLDYDNDGLVNDHAHAQPGESWPANQYYDNWPWCGTSAYVAGTWLGTLRAALALAEVVGDKEALSQWKEWLKNGEKSYEDKLWNGEYYRLYNDPDKDQLSETCLGNQLMGVWCTNILGLKTPLPEERIKKALSSIKKLNLRATKHGLVNGVRPDGSRDDTGYGYGENDHGQGIFVGENLCSAMTFMYCGQAKVGMEITRRLYEAIAVLHRTPWNQHCLISAGDGHPIWGQDYYSDMAFWAVPMARKGLNITSLIAEGGLVDRILKAGEKEA